MNSVWRVLEIALSLQRAAFREADREAEHTAREAEPTAREAEPTAREADRAVSTTRRAAERAADGITPPSNP